MSSTLRKLSKIKKFRLIKSNKISNIQFKFDEIMCTNRKIKTELEEDIDNEDVKNNMKMRTLT